MMMRDPRFHPASAPTLKEEPRKVGPVWPYELQNQIEKLKIKWSKQTTAAQTRRKLTCEERLVIVFRRLPFAIRYSSKTSIPAVVSRGVIYEDPAEAAVVEGDPSNVQGLWKLMRNEHAIDFRAVFSPGVQVILLGEPDVDVSPVCPKLPPQQQQLDKIVHGDDQIKEKLEKRLRSFLHKLNVTPVILTSRAKNERYSEDVMYPLFHYRTPPIGTGFLHLDYPAYVEANQQFAAAVAHICQPNDKVLVLNYSLMLLPEMIKSLTRKLEKVSVMFHFPIAFPSSEMYRILPQRQELLKGVLHADAISFHSHQYRSHFMTAVTRVLGAQCRDNTVEPCVQSGGSGVRMFANPMGVSVSAWTAAAGRVDLENLRSRFNGRKIILGVDYLDYTKGIPQKMLAFRKFLTDNPEWADRVLFLQLCSLGNTLGQIDGNDGSLQKLSHFDRKEILTQVFQLTGHLNSLFGTVDRMPVHFLLADFGVDELASVYGLADIALITPLREALSASAYHFTICQRNTNKGVILLSEFSGSHHLLGASVLSVNPWDTNAFAVAILDALTMPEDERQARHELAYQIVSKRDVVAWAHQVESYFQDIADDAEEDKVEVPPPLPIDGCVEELCKVKHMVIVCGVRDTLFKSPPAVLDEDALNPNCSGPEQQSNEPDSDDDRDGIPECIPKVNTISTALLHPPTAAARWPQSPASILALSIAGGILDDINTLADIEGTSSVILVSSCSIAMMERLLPDVPNAWIFAENGHYFRGPGDSEFRMQPLPTPTSQPAEKPVLHKRGSSFMMQASSVDSAGGECGGLQECLAGVEDLVGYFALRTPGSYVRKTEFSISWHYGDADNRFAMSQAKDLLFHLYAGPLVNDKNLELCVGMTSVEVRDRSVTKSQAVEWALGQICEQRQVPPSELGVVCLGNLLPSDEDMYQNLMKFLGHLPGTSRTSPPRANASPCFTCTIGVRLSKAQYRLDNLFLTRILLRRLAEKVPARYPSVSPKNLLPLTPPPEPREFPPQQIGSKIQSGDQSGNGGEYDHYFQSRGSYNDMTNPGVRRIFSQPSRVKPSKPRFLDNFDVYGAASDEEEILILGGAATLTQQNAGSSHGRSSMSSSQRQGSIGHDHDVKFFTPLSTRR